MAYKIEFIIDDVKIENNILNVEGICNVGPIKLDDYFNATYKSENINTSIEIKKILLQVKKIITYKNEVNELPTGMSGKLFLEGDGKEFVAVGHNIGFS